MAFSFGQGLAAFGSGAIDEYTSIQKFRQQQALDQLKEQALRSELESTEPAFETFLGGPGGGGLGGLGGFSKGPPPSQVPFLTPAQQTQIPPGGPAPPPDQGQGPLPPAYVQRVKGFEGYSPTAYPDYKQTSIGYGTRAQPGEQRIDEQTASSRLQDELYKAAKAVDEKFPGLPQGPRAALVDLTYNTGTAWFTSGLGKAVGSQDWPTAQRLLQQYVNAGGRPLPGLQARRAETAGWMGGKEPSEGGYTQTNLAAGERPQMSLMEAAQRIERNYPQASPQAKFMALQRVSGLLNEDAKMQLAQ